MFTAQLDANTQLTPTTSGWREAKSTLQKITLYGENTDNVKIHNTELGTYKNMFRLFYKLVVFMSST